MRSARQNMVCNAESLQDAGFLTLTLAHFKQSKSRFGTGDAPNRLSHRLSFISCPHYMTHDVSGIDCVVGGQRASSAQSPREVKALLLVTHGHDPRIHNSLTRLEDMDPRLKAEDDDGEVLGFVGRMIKPRVGRRHCSSQSYRSRLHVRASGRYHQDHSAGSGA